MTAKLSTCFSRWIVGIGWGWTRRFITIGFGPFLLTVQFAMPKGWVSTYSHKIINNKPCVVLSKEVRDE